jgi:hypothetical protein
LVELVEIDSGPESERMRNDFWRRVPVRFRLLTETRAERPIDHVLERHTEFARSPLEEAGEIIVYSERGAHASIMYAIKSDVKTSNPAVVGHFELLLWGAASTRQARQISN